MRRGYRKTTAWGLLLLMAIPLFFAAGVLLKQKILQLKRRARFETEMMQSISVNINDFQWVKKGKEARINGKLFDVKAFSVSGNQVLATGFFDHQEDKLVDQLHKLNPEKNDAAKSTPHIPLLKFFFGSAYTGTEPPSVQRPWHTQHQLLHEYAELIQHRSLTADTPPPQAA